MIWRRSKEEGEKHKYLQLSRLKETALFSCIVLRHVYLQENDQCLDEAFQRKIIHRYWVSFDKIKRKLNVFNFIPFMPSTSRRQQPGFLWSLNLVDWIKFQFSRCTDWDENQLIFAVSSVKIILFFRICHNPSPSPKSESKVKSLRTWSDSILLCHPPPPTTTQTFLSYQTSNWAQIFTVGSQTDLS